MPKIILNIRESILKEGELLLAKNGYEKLNMREVARYCGIAVGTLYNYFANKDELVEQIIFSQWEEILVHIENLTVSEVDLKEKLLVLYQYLDEFFKSHSSIFADILESTANRCPRHDIVPHLHARVENMLQIAIENGEIRPHLSSDKIAKILVSSMFFITRMEDLTFEDFYSILNLN